MSARNADLSPDLSAAVRRARTAATSVVGGAAVGRDDGAPDGATAVTGRVRRGAGGDEQGGRDPGCGDDSDADEPQCRARAEPPARRLHGHGRLERHRDLGPGPTWAPHPARGAGLQAPSTQTATIPPCPCADGAR